MIKQFLSIWIIIAFLVVGLCGCIEEPEPRKIQYYGDDETLTADYPDITIKLEVYGNNSTYTVTKETNVVDVWIYGDNSTVVVSRSHSFDTHNEGNNSIIDYYD